MTGSIRSKLRPWIGNLALLVVSVSLALGLVEYLLRTQIPPPFVTVVRASTVEGLPYQLRPNISVLYFGNRADINSHGFRGPAVSATKKEGVRRIALIGDSNTFGHVPYEETLAVYVAANLQKRGEDVEVLNCGVPGYDASHVAIMLEAQVLALHPDVVVYLFFSNDVPLPGPSPPANVDADHVVDQLNDFPLRSALLELSGRTAKAALRSIGLFTSGGFVADTLNNWRHGGADRLQGELRKMQGSCSARHVRLLVAGIPVLLLPKANPFMEIEKGTKDACAEIGLPYIDLRQAFPANEDLRRYHVGLFDNHPNGKANQRMAALLAKPLQSVSP